MNEYVRAFTDSIDKVFRYLVPGLILFFGFIYSYPAMWESLSKGPLVLLIFGIWASGFAWYSIYRGVLTLFEYGFIFRTNLSAIALFKQKKNAEAVAKFIFVRQMIREKLRGLSNYLDIRWSFAHLMTQTALIGLLFSFLHNIDSMKIVSEHSYRYFFCALFVLAVLHQSVLYRWEKKILLQLFDPKTEQWKDMAKVLMQAKSKSDTESS